MVPSGLASRLRLALRDLSQVQRAAESFRRPVIRP
jgi:hypothetical protein